MDNLPQNEYIRYLDNRSGVLENLQKPRMEDGILLTPDGLRWRIETTPCLSDLLHVGDKIRTNYGTNNEIVVKMSRSKTCCCPLRAVSREKYCVASWESPEMTKEFHVDVWSWSIAIVHESQIRTLKDKTLRDDSHFGHINELVAFDGRILKLFENNRDEVFIDPSPARGTFQLSMI